MVVVVALSAIIIQQQAKPGGTFWLDRLGRVPVVESTGSTSTLPAGPSCYRYIQYYRTAVRPYRHDRIGIVPVVYLQVKYRYELVLVLLSWYCPGTVLGVYEVLVAARSTKYSMDKYSWRRLRLTRFLHPGLPFPRNKTKESFFPAR